MANKKNTYQIGRDAINDRFITIKKALLRKNTSVVETFKRKK